jgi:hypothetical protein
MLVSMLSYFAVSFGVRGLVELVRPYNNRSACERGDPRREGALGESACERGLLGEGASRLISPLSG